MLPLVQNTSLYQFVQKELHKVLQYSVNDLKGNLQDTLF